MQFKGVIVLIGLMSLFIAAHAQDDVFAIITPANAGQLEVIQTIQLTDTHANQIAFNPTDSTLAAVQSNGIVSIWNVVTGTHLNNLPASSGINDVSYTPDGTALITADESCAVTIWRMSDIYEAERALCVESDAENDPVLLSVTNKLIAAAYRDGKVRLWQLSTGELLTTIYGYASLPRAIALSPDETLLAIGWQNLVLYRINRVESGDVSLHSVTPIILENFVNEIAFHPGPTALPSAVDSGLTTLETVIGGDLVSGSPVMWTFFSPVPQPFDLGMPMLHRSQMAYNTTGTLLVLAGADTASTQEDCQQSQRCVVQIWPVERSSDNPEQFAVNPTVADLQGAAGAYLDLALSADDRFLALSTSMSSITIWGIPQP